MRSHRQPGARLYACSTRLGPDTSGNRSRELRPWRLLEFQGHYCTADSRGTGSAHAAGVTHEEITQRCYFRVPGSLLRRGFAGLGLNSSSGPRVIEPRAASHARPVLLTCFELQGRCYTADSRCTGSGASRPGRTRAEDAWPSFTGFRGHGFTADSRGPGPLRSLSSIHHQTSGPHH